MSQHFKIITVGWDCAAVIEQTLRSVEEQTEPNWQIHIVSDKGPDPEQERIIRDWCDPRRAAGDKRWAYTLNDDQRYAVRNQVEGIRAMGPEPDDVIVWLDLDGDRLAHPHVLEHLADYYRDDTLLTYGSYIPDPLVTTTTPAHAFPNQVIAANSYRHYIATVSCAFNHLRTMKYKVAAAIPDSHFHWPDGTWLNACADYAYMMAGLELAGPRHKFISETLLIYNHDQPHPDYLYHPQVNAQCGRHVFSQQPLEPLP